MTPYQIKTVARVLAVLAALSLTCAVTLPAQGSPPDAGLLRWYQGDRELGRESFRRTAALFETETQIPMLNLKLRYRSDYDSAGRVARFEGRAFDLRADTLVRVYVAVVDGDTLRIRQTGGRPADTSWVRAAQFEGVVPSQSLAAMLELVQRAGGHDWSSFVWSPESDNAMRFSVAFHGDSVAARLGPFQMIARFGVSGRVERLEIPMQRLRIERWNGRDSLPPLEGMNRPTPDYTAPAGAPYTTEDVRVPARAAEGDTFSLAGTLTLPRAGRPPYPAAITVSGSGQQDRDENLWPLLPGFRPFRQVAERLAEAGIAVLRYDDRGFGASTGQPARATTEDFAGDAAAVVAYLRTRPDIDPARIALVGHSEGGVIGPMVAVADPRLAAVVLMAGTGKNGVEVLKDQVSWPIESTPGMSAERKAELRAEALQALVNDTTPIPWLRWFRQYEPLPTARRVRQPALILQGALDRQVTAGQADTLAAAMRAGGNRDVTVRVFPGLNHLFVPSPTDGSPSEYPSLRDAAIPREVLDTLADWLARRLRVAGSR
ncbi:MAG: alpha/beta fold hydrolase [Verrucomicrobiota bacterium]